MLRSVMNIRHKYHLIDEPSPYKFHTASIHQSWVKKRRLRYLLFLRKFSVYKPQELPTQLMQVSEWKSLPIGFWSIVGSICFKCEKEFVISIQTDDWGFSPFGYRIFRQQMNIFFWDRLAFHSPETPVTTNVYLKW
jgi:hypothetical protein